MKNMNKKNIIKKSLVFGIMFLFITLGNISSVGDNIEKNSIKVNNYAPLSAPLNNDYIDAYWKFDECTGNILEDSSGNNYDGTIYDSTWISGKSDCALDFDGTDDYVDLDIYSLELGFNKTDDMIFSLWFRSDFSNGGYIYCIAGNQHVPEALIELCPNGSIHFKVWTSVCGIEAFSDENHNDGSWHYAEIFFNGITAKPTIEIYIDEELEGSRTKWLCEVVDSDFNKAKIGRRAQSAVYFYDGQADEFKIVKYPGGNNQDQPDISGQTSGYPGVEYEFTFIAEDPEKDNIWYYIDWDDTTFEDWFGPYDSGQAVVVSHSWNQEGTYEIKAKSKDYWDDSRWSDPHVIKIGNMNPESPLIVGPKIGGVGTEYEYELVATDPDGDDVYYYMDWDDGDTSGWIGPYKSGNPVKINHTWTSEGTYYIKAKAKDIYQEESSWTEDFVVTIVENDPPTVPNIDGPNRGKVGVDYTYIFTASDSDGDDVAYYIDWGDDSSSTWSTFQTSGTAYNEDHKWNSQGRYTIKAKAKDIYNAESDWSQLEIEIPRNRVMYNSLFYWLFDHFTILLKILYFR
jgi:hypothetical protein